MPRTGTEAGTLVALAALVMIAAPAAAQHEGMDHGAMDHGAMDMGAGWRMPPMEGMPMMPGLDGALPPVGPFLAGAGVDVMTLPEARPSEPVTVADGDTLDVSVSLVRRTIDGHTLAMYGYNGQYPGPLIRADRGSTVVVRVTNDIRLPTTVHWHGIRIENRFDGVPGLTQAPIEPGEQFVYEVNVPDAGMFWYHPHVREDVQQDLGLYGNLLVVPGDAEYYGPAHREELLVLDDLLMDDAGLIPWGDEAPTHALMGRFGNVMLVNGRTDAELTVRRGEVVRFYVTNVANSRTFNTVFGNARVKLVAGDVSKFEREAWIPSVPIAPAERYVVDVRFEEPGTTAITNTIQAVNHFRGEFYPHVDTLVRVTVEDGPAAPDLGAAFDVLRENGDVVEDIDPFRPHFDRPPDYELATTVQVRDLPLAIVRAMEIDTLYVPPMEWNDAMPMMNWLSTAEQVTWVLEDRATGARNGDIHWTFDRGDLAKIRIFNDPESFHPMNHPIHIHGQRYLVLSRDGIPQENLAWKDTAILPVGSTMDLLVDMSNPGDWMVHCHIAEHLHAGMMFHFTVRDRESAESEGAGEP